ncbi:MAG: hypothetical protein A3J65_03805 [Candidatus Buchananbacteria bacterium RIFCSPHIGHO2_02_FULL_45_11b]|uniref:Uncharacterized protein n=4 Tax=Candidatus Buchananiibacteriota TaxID=1817903 RepID=A0A1G1YKW4_9BACT|nr:MAG: hypothetical protein A2663_01445 [Candidatus Buchananbacteria bacterium RIFCSPHIGHO2_01_FULL_46_12]OGY51750.1 MAG: hypothetical protein A3J65_03805 [Candidatus Buchananbacteria bacterium RIFCSPHIGHO2_02_FULL_45_11b]OGY52983.1 MAG: hypothetical protein A3B15_03000 [Candidatus Buchananbacteria bacterium RIFCSPLOWO2_01_FULL_45_31]OGY56440.1 MAG: hypothetical protein A3H67_05210 [Candidatus Buchananbacteria bacterium RIFCSPLOWO2_02_FULL_46_11b]
MLLFLKRKTFQRLTFLLINDSFIFMNRKSKYIFLSQFNAFLSRGALSAVFLALAFYPSTAVLAETSTSTATTTWPTLVESEAAVRSYFAEIPIMISIAKCESGYRQHNSDGTPLRHLDYIGVFQIDENIHAKKALGLGWDIHTLDGNLAYAKYLYNQLGAGP